MTKMYSLSELIALTESKVKVHDDRYEVVPIVDGGDFLYDPQVFWNWANDGAHSAWAGPEGSILISDIGGQRNPGIDWNLGHVGILRLHADNSWEPSSRRDRAIRRCHPPNPIQPTLIPNRPATRTSIE